MDTADLYPLVEDLTSNVDDLEESLAPLLKTALSHSTSKLPLLDKAKLYVLATYALESILFSSLRLNGVDAKSHPVFQELARVKEYFAKIKTAETGPAKRSTTLDKDAANRFIKHGLAGNDRFDRERTERMLREKSGAKRKLEDMQVGTHTRFDGAAKRMKASEEQNGHAISTGDISSDQQGAAVNESAPEPITPKAKKEKSSLEKKARRERRRLEKEMAGLSGAENQAAVAEVDVDEEIEESPKADPSDHQAALEALLDDSLPSGDSKKAKKRKKKKSKGQKLEDERADEMK